MDFDIEKLPLYGDVNYIVREGEDWSITREFRQLMRGVGQSYIFMRLYTVDKCALVMTPECAINLGRDLHKRGPAALQTPYTMAQNNFKPVTLLNDHVFSRKPTVLLLKNNRPPEVLLVLMVEEFNKLSNLFSDSLSLDYFSAFN